MDTSSSPPEKKPAKRAPNMKAAMREWSEQHPQEAAERLAARQRIREQRKAAVLLSQLIGSAMIEKAAGRLDEMLDAQAPVVVNLPGSVEEGKPVQGGQEVQFVPDNRARLEAVKIVAAYSEGLPVARQMVVNADFRDLDAEKRELLMGSSAVMEALGDLQNEGEGESERGLFTSPSP
jgi:hypothetical protein